MHAALLLASSSARSASAFIFTALATISCATLSASATVLRAVACASAKMLSRSACAMATASATGSNVFAAAKASAGNRSTVRSAGAAASGALVVALSLPSSRATKTPVRSRAAIVSVETVPISSATGIGYEERESHIFPRDLPASPACATILDVIGDLLADGCQVEKLLLDEGILGLFGKLQIHGRLLPKIVIPVHNSSGTRRAVVEHSGRRDLGLKQQGCPIEGGLDALARLDQPTNATRSWAAASAAVAGCAGSWSTVAS